MTQVVVNYTDEQTVAIVQAYQAGQSVEGIALQAQRSVKSIIAKLVREGVYKKPERARNPRGLTKLELVAKLGELLDAEVESLKSFEKVDKPALLLLVDTLEGLIGR